jgi:hypothetical protein
MWNVPAYRRASTFTELMVVATIVVILYGLVALLQRLGGRDEAATRAGG